MLWDIMDLRIQLFLKKTLIKYKRVVYFTFIIDLLIDQSQLPDL